MDLTNQDVTELQAKEGAEVVRGRFTLRQPVV
jgi:hypothetical protein